MTTVKIIKQLLEKALKELNEDIQKSKGLTKDITDKQIINNATYYAYKILMEATGWDLKDTFRLISEHLKWDIKREEEK